MKGPRTLNREQRFFLYTDLVRRPLSFSEKDLSLFIQNARLDPRLAEVVTEHLRDYWWKYDAKALNKKLKAQPWPSAVKPMLFQILEFCAVESETARAEFGQWVADVLSGIESVPSGLFFVSPFAPRSRSMEREITESLPSFRRAGFFAKDRLFNKGRPEAIKARPLMTNRAITSEDLIKLELLKEIRESLGPEGLSAKKFSSLDRTLRSKLKLGRLDKLSVKALGKVLDLARANF